MEYRVDDMEKLLFEYVEVKWGFCNPCWNPVEWTLVCFQGKVNDRKYSIHICTCLGSEKD